MGLNLRKLIVGLTVLAVLLGVYVAHTRWGGNAPIEARDVPAPGPNDLAPAPTGRSGAIGGTTIDRIYHTRLIHADAAGHIDRDFGFEELYHSQGKQWEATHPFMTLYQSSFKCSVTADKGQVQTESNFDRLIPNDAAFSGNVVIHITASEPNDEREAFIYLDDVVFTAEKSMFSTSGPVRFVSRSAKLVGRGMELLYDEQHARLEQFSIQELDNFRLRSEAFRTFFNSSHRGGERPPAQSTAGGSKSGARSNAVSAGSPAMEAYECVLRKNVQIVTPEQVVRAEDRLCITNIPWSGSGSEAADRTEAASGTGGTKRKTEPNEPQETPYPRHEAMDTTGSSALTLDSLPESLFDIVVTCQGGLVIRPMGATSPDGAAAQGADSNETSGFQDVNDPLRQVIVARRIDVDASTVNATLPGPVQMAFPVDANGLAGVEGDSRKIPVTVTAQKDVRYFSASKQVVLDGDCVATARWPEPNGTAECTLKSPKLTLDLAEDPNSAKQGGAAGNRPWGLAVSMARATASGGFDLLTSRKTTLGVTSGIEMQGTELDYEARQNSFMATGPGQIYLSNPEGTGDKEDANSFSFRKPCIARLQNFDRLTYRGLSSRIVAESKSRQLQVDYFTLADGREDQWFKIDVGRVDVELTRAADNRMELATLAASQGIAFEEGVRQFDGSTLFYDYRTGLMTIRGDQHRPCYFNGTLVDGIEMNVKTGRIKANVIAPSALSTR